MNKNLLYTFAIIGALGLATFIFFAYKIKPIEIDYATPEDIEELTEPTVTFVNPRKGAEEPTLTIIEYGDFECGPCQSLGATLDAVVKAFPDDVQVVWKNLPNESLHEFATPAAMAAHCADEQGRFWDYHDELFNRQSYLSESQFVQIAEQLELNVNEFTSCYDARDTLPIIKKDFQEALGLGLTSTPTLYIGSEMLIGAVTLNEIMDIVTTQLAQIK